MTPRERIRSFITETFFVEDFADDDSFLSSGIIDSTGMLELTLFVETEDAAALGRRMRELPGISGHVHLEVDGIRAERVVIGGPGLPLGAEPVQCRSHHAAAAAACHVVHEGRQPGVVAEHEEGERRLHARQPVHLADRGPQGVQARWVVEVRLAVRLWGGRARRRPTRRSPRSSAEN